MLDLHVQVQASLRPINFLTAGVRAHMVAIDLLSSSPVVLLSPVGFFFIELLIVLIIVRFELDDLL